MSELSCKNCTPLYDKAVRRATVRGDDWLLTLLRAMNPKRMSQSDIDTCDDIVRGDV